MRAQGQQPLRSEQGQTALTTLEPLAAWQPAVPPGLYFCQLPSPLQASGLPPFSPPKQTALKGLAVADAARDAWHGTSLRHVLAGSMAMAGEAATPGRLRVGVLRRLIGEAAMLQQRYRSWVVSLCVAAW